MNMAIHDTNDGLGNLWSTNSASTTDGLFNWASVVHYKLRFVGSSPESQQLNYQPIKVKFAGRGDLEIYIREKDAEEYKKRMIELGKRIEKLN
jgi:hypothetical protein